jgi:hypothetical protein
MMFAKSPNTDEVKVPKMVTLECKWESLHDVEVPDDWNDGDPLPEGAMDGITSATAYLLDWKSA